jgi:hypothetical protein
MILKSAFNMMTRIHSRPATLKRLGTPVIYSPARITPSNYFRYLEGPSHTVVRGREFIIPVDTMLGQPSFTFVLPSTPTTGSYTLDFDFDLTTASTASINFDADLVAITAAIVGVVPDAVVTGTPENYSVVLEGVQVLNSIVATSTLDVVETITAGNTPWTIPTKRGDRIVDSVYGTMTMDEIIEIVDLGGDIMGYRCRVE